MEDERNEELQILESVKRMIDENTTGGSISNGPSLLEFANSLSVEDLLRMIPELEAKFPKKDMLPNPADVHPATFSALMMACDGTLPSSPVSNMAAIVLHVRTDVEPWKLHPCTCKEMIVAKPIL